MKKEEKGRNNSFPLTQPCARYRGGRYWTGTQLAGAAVLDLDEFGFEFAVRANVFYSY